jgi:two-component system nitrate/nitrite response regulator NarL
MDEITQSWLESPDHGQGLDEPRLNHRGTAINGAAPIRVAVVNHPALLSEVLRSALARNNRIEVVLDLDNTNSDLWKLRDAQADVVLLRSDPEQGSDVVRTVAEHLGPAKLIVLSGAESSSEKNEVVAQAFDAGASGYVSMSLPLTAVIDAIVGDGAHNISHTGRPSARRPRPEGRDRYLTEREREVLRRFASGESTRNIATDLGVSLATVRTHTQNILTKLGVHSKVEAAAYAARNNLT